jgi:C4-dicarboxylate-binding protein DctP
MEAIRKSGKTVVYNLTDQEKTEWRKALLPVQKQMENRIGKDLITAVNQESAKLGYK